MKTNLMLFFAAISCVSCISMEEKANDYVRGLEPEIAPIDLITEEEIAVLPPIVQKYFYYSQVIGQPRPQSFGFFARGRLRDSSTSNWMNVESRQYNRLNSLARVYYIEVLGIPMKGIDSMIEGRGRMEIQLLGFLKVADAQGSEMDEAGLTTFLNDLVFCPSAYFSVPVQWEQIGENQAQLSLENQGIVVSALLTFSQEGSLINWESSNRYASIKDDYLPDHWSTHYYEYTMLQGMMIPTRIDVVHDYDDDPYVYGRFDQITELEINGSTLP